MEQSNRQWIHIKENKKQYLDLLLLADESEQMIDHYLEDGEMYALKEDKAIGVIVVKKIGEGELEIKNLAIHPDYQSQGIGRMMIEKIVDIYHDSYHTLFVGTGDSPLTIPFYEKCQFTRSHRIPNFFIDHYDHPIYEAGVQLVDMIYLKRPFLHDKS